MSQDVEETVRKLLRLASNNPNQYEAATARAHAQRLIVKHGIVLEDVEEHREEAPATDGVHWREQLLGAIAKENFCTVGVDKKTRRASLSGTHADVANVRALYSRGLAQLATDCAASWRAFEFTLWWLRDREGGREIWFDTFLNTAIDVIIERTRKAAVTTGQGFGAMPAEHPQAAELEKKIRQHDRGMELFTRALNLGAETGARVALHAQRAPRALDVASVAFPKKGAKRKRRVTGTASASG